MPRVIKQTTLEKIASSIEECKEIIANKQAEIRELKTAAAVFRRMEGVSEKESFAGKKIRECARILLNEKSPQHYQELTREAVARGYVSQKGGDIEVVSRSFLATLNTSTLNFKNVGGGKFELVKLPPLKN